MIERSEKSGRFRLVGPDSDPARFHVSARGPRRDDLVPSKLVSRTVHTVHTPRLRRNVPWPVVARILVMVGRALNSR